MDEMIWIQTKLNEICDHNKRFIYLHEIHDAFKKQPVSLNPLIAATLLKSDNFQKCIDVKDSVEVTLVVDIMTKAFKSLNVKADDFTEIIIKNLNYNNEILLGITLNGIIDLIQIHNLDTFFTKELLLAIISRCFKTENLIIGTKTVDILTIVLPYFYHFDDIRNNFVALLDDPNVSACRVYEISTNICSLTPSKLNEFDDIFTKMISKLDSWDILLKLNILELFAILAKQNQCVEYLENRNVFEKLSKEIENTTENSIETIYYPGIMKFFGKVGYSQPQKIINDYPKVIEILLKNLISDDLSLLAAALDTFALISQSGTGVELLQKNFGEKVSDTLMKLKNLVKNVPTDFKITIINVLKTILNSNSANGGILEKWYKSFAGSKDSSFILQYCENSFPDIKLAFLSFVKTLCTYEWGIISIKETSGFVEYLLNRDIEFDKEILILKYDIVKILYDSNKFSFDQTIHLNLMKYVAEGVLHNQNMVNISLEGAE